MKSFIAFWTFTDPLMSGMVELVTLEVWFCASTGCWSIRTAVADRATVKMAKTTIAFLPVNLLLLMSSSMCSEI
jgi:hypothetical protein